MKLQLLLRLQQQLIKEIKIHFIQDSSYPEL